MYVVRPVAALSDLVGVDNGRLPDGLLAEVQGGRLHRTAARSWLAMVDAARRDGVTLRATSIADLYRSYEWQERLFLLRYTTEPLAGRPTRSWRGQTWWLRPGVAAAATPGRSNHGWGLAVDVCTTVNGQVAGLSPYGLRGTRQRDAWDWLLAHYEDFGWSHEWSSPSSEPWHIRYVDGDSVPRALRLPDPVPPQPPEVTDMAHLTPDCFLRVDLPDGGYIVYAEFGGWKTWMRTDQDAEQLRSRNARLGAGVVPDERMALTDPGARERLRSQPLWGGARNLNGMYDVDDYGVPLQWA